ncbi:MAG: radical SAM family heme chaperone HemW [Bacillota bacterium]|nr:radical SAM family heme chaperone HemW [Bacillota bacterium]
MTGAPDRRAGRPPHLYVHVPFCARKCAYCDFVSYPRAAAGGGPAVRRYLETLAREAGWYAGRLAPTPISTVYVGGGTPSVLTSSELRALLAVLSDTCGPWAEGAEVTAEVNPGTADAGKLAVLREAGVNRLSVGVQSFDEALLRRVGRFVKPDEVYTTVQAAREAGFANLSLDLIFGLPGQTLEGLEEDLRRAVDLEPEHLSVYALTLEEGTPLAEEVAAGRAVLPGEAVEAEMFALASAVLRQAGYRHYELSNFAQPGREARHNLAYWHNEDYLALGPAASGHAGLLRYRNAPGLGEYERLLAEGRRKPGQAGAGGEGFPLSPAAVEVERLSLRQAMGETAFLALRLVEEGLDREAFRRRFGRDPLDVWGGELARLEREGLVEVAPTAVRLTAKALPVANLVFSAFV